MEMNQLGHFFQARRAAGAPDIEYGPFAFADVLVEIVSIAIHAFEQRIGSRIRRVRESR